MSFTRTTSIVIPAKAGIQSHTGYRSLPWIPAFAGMTDWGQRSAR